MSVTAIVFAAVLALAGVACLVWGIRRMARSQSNGGTRGEQSGLGGGAFGVQVTLNGPWPLVVSGFGVVMLIVAAVLVIVQPDSSPAASSASSSRVSEPPTNSTVSSSPRVGPSCGPGASLSSPSDNTYVQNGARGIVIRGSVCDLRNKFAWLFDWDSHDKFYYFDYPGGAPTPITTLSNGKWHFQDKPIGDSGDNQKEYIITLVTASPACNQALLEWSNVGDTYRLRKFPPGCHIVDQRVVYVTYP